MPSGAPDPFVDKNGIRRIDDAMLVGLRTGDWNAVLERVELKGAPIRMHNDPPLRPGDVCEIHPGNDLQWGSVGKICELHFYKPVTRKWGVEIKDGGADDNTAMIKEDNLKRLNAAGGGHAEADEAAPESTSETEGATADNALCANCNAPAPLCCSRCGRIKYCGRACQKAHWKLHKRSCGRKGTPSSASSVFF